MYLKALEIQGFKSFPEKTRLTFEKQITGIVGPNGSGKSNISDALLWVMGEQRSKALRGGKMEDVVFGGTEKRSPMGFAQVSLILDNAGGLFAVDAPEVVITRRYYRTGESEYSINRESVRLRDVTELLMDTGLGRDGYSVIGQGRIDEIVSAKSTDRREIFEEAAGIARYRRRKEEAQKKLEGTRDNLLRINDKIDELEMQVTPLQKQAETAKKYLVLRDEQRTLEISVWMETLDRLRDQAQSINEAYENAKFGLEQAQQELNELYARSESFSEKMRMCDVEAEGVRAQQAHMDAQTAENESSMAVLRANIKHNEDNIQRIKEEMSEQLNRAKNLDEQITEQENRIAQIERDRALTEEKIGKAQEATRRNAEENGEAQKGLTELVSAENACNDALTHASTVLTMLTERYAELTQRGGSIDADIAAGRDRLTEITQKLRTSQQDAAKAKEHFDELNNIINGHKMRMGGREKTVSELSEKLNGLTVDIRSAEGRINMLSEMEKDYEGLGRAVKNVMREAGRGTLRGIHGPVASLIDVDDKYALAIETAVGGAMQHIVVENQEAGKSAVEMLKRTDGGRDTFIPMVGIRASTMNRVPAGEPGYVGIASDLIRFAPEYSSVFQYLLGRTVVAESLADAIKISKKFDNQLRIVSLDGQLINAGGSMTGGSTAKNVGILSRANELKKLREKRDALAEQERACRTHLEEAQRELSAAKYEMDVAGSELTEATEVYHRARSAQEQAKLLQSAAEDSLESLEAEKTGLAARLAENEAKCAQAKADQEKNQSRLDEIRREIQKSSSGCSEFEKRRDELAAELARLHSEIASLDAERDVTVRTVERLEEMRGMISGDEKQRLDHLSDMEKTIEFIKAELESRQSREAEYRQNADTLKEQLEKINAGKLELEGRRTKCEKDGQDKNRELLDMQAVCSKFEQKKISSEMEENQIVDKLWENYELSRTAAQALRQKVESMSQATKRISELRREIGRLGSVNVGAIEEYQRVSERYDFLSEQRNDVEKAKRELEKIISDITGEMEEIFVRAFHDIDEKFREVFLELFGGGRASLQLEDEENVLECGIEIKVQPPGKAVTTISLLSGGEKAFVAIALYFAIMKIRPTPFCIMDEIDAALDEANVNRYAEYMKSMAGKTQFIVITHHRGTMEQADMLYGVTMQERGVTTVISVDLDEAERTLGNT